MHREHQVVLLLGAPGAGKGTQARFIGEALAIPHVASGDLLREHRRRGTPLGRAAQAYMDRGDLVPDDLVVEMVMERLERPDAARGALLDGFPRTLPQAEALDRRLTAAGSGIRWAIYLAVPKATLIERLAGRWICGECQTTFHERFDPPRVDGVCTTCGGKLIQRPDDRPEVVENRVDVYLRETLPVVERYTARGLLNRLEGNGQIADVRILLCATLGGVVHGQRRDRWHLFVPQIGPEGDGSRWLGRTLCGKYVGREAEGHLGRVEQFRASPCRHCEHALRPHDGQPQAPAPSSAPLASSA